VPSGAPSAPKRTSDVRRRKVAGETDGRELSVPILRHLLRDRDGLDESRVGGLPVSLDTHLFLDQAAE
jgi:hypothetical protein